MRKLAVITIAALALGAAPAAAQSPDPTVEQQLCVTFQHTPGTVITTGEVSAQLADGTATIVAIQPGESCLPVVEPTADTDYLLWADFLGREAAAESRLDDLKGQVSDAIDQGKFSNVSKRSATTASFLKKEVAWLDDNPPADCYADAWQGYRDAWSMYRKAFTDVAYGAKHSNYSRLDRATSELDDANSLYDDIDLDAVTCELSA